MARPGYNEDNTLNKSVYSAPSNRDLNMGHRNTGNNNPGNQNDPHQISNDLDRMLRNRQQESPYPDLDYDDSWESQPNKFVEPYTPPEEIYNKAGPDQKRQWTGQLWGQQPWIKDLLQGVNKETLDFWGVKDNSRSIPVELYQMLSEGTIIGSNEKMWGDLDPDKKGFQYGNENLTGTWGDVEAGVHPFWKDTNQYYDEMGLDKYIPADTKTTTSGGGGGGGGGGYGGGGGGGRPPEKFTPQGQQNEAWGQQTPWQQMMINTHGGQSFNQGYKRGGIVSLVC